MPSHVYDCTVTENIKLSEGSEIRSLIFHCPEIAERFSPGQVVHILCGPYTLRRPFGICENQGENLRICYDVRGKGTTWMAGLSAGDRVNVMGPFGHGYTIRENGTVLLVGGGTGIYPLLALGKRYGARATALLGFRTASLVNLVGDFLQHGVNVRIISDDGTTGRKGFVTELLREHLEPGGIAAVHVCGPTPMMKAAAAVAGEFGVPCEVSLEERMGCGVGACQACVCKTLLSDGGEEYKRVCIDGPVFDSRTVKWQ